MKVLISNLINLSLFFSILFFFLNKKELSLFFILVTLFSAIIAIFVISSKNKKIYFLIILCMLALTFVSKSTKSLIRNGDKVNKVAEVTDSKIVDDLLQDIYIDIKNGSANQTILDKTYILISQAKMLLSKNNTKTYIDLGKAYEVGAVIGIEGASDLALQTYNEFCKLEPNNPDCYTTLAKFLILDKNRKGEALVLSKMALTLSRNEEETKNINDLIIYIESLK